MLQQMRRGAQTFGAKILAGVICFVLAVFGFGAFNLFGVSEPLAAKVNGTEISQAKLGQSVTNAKRRMAQQSGDSLSEEQLDLYVTPAGELRGLVDRELLLQTAQDLDLAGSQKEFQEFLRAVPAFKNEQQEFDPEVYVRVLQTQGHSPRTFEALISEDTRVQQLYQVFTNTAFVTEFERRDAATVQHQRRDFAYLILEPGAFRDSVQISEEDIASHYEANLDTYLTPESFDFEVVRLRSDGMADDILISDEQLEEHYATELAAATANAARNSSHILLKITDERTREDAIRELQEVKAQVLAGESFEDFARELSEGPSGADGGSLGSATRDTYVEPFSDALWSLTTVGELSEPTETRFGIHLIRLDGIEEVVHPSLEERREEIFKERKDELELERFEQTLERFDKVAFEQSDSLQPLADEFGLEIVTHSEVRRNQSAGLFANRALRTAALDDDVLRNGFNSQVVQIEPGTAVVARLKETNSSRQLPLEDVSEKIDDQLREEEANRLVAEATERAQTQLEEEKVDYGDVADELGIKWEKTEGGYRNAPEPERAIINAAFSTPIPDEGTRELAVASLPGGGKALVVVSAVILGDYAATSESERDNIGSKLATVSEQLGYGSLIESLRASADVVSYLPGFDPADPLFRVTSQAVEN